MNDRISAVRDFWNATPCDGQPTYALRARFRYGKDPFLLDMVKQIAAGRHQNVLEVGCGQGTDGVTLCRFLRPEARYTGVDMSEVSLASAREAAREAAADLTVQPTFRLENAERLSFPDGSFDCVLSVGALHHSADTEQALAEVRRVLAPGGTAVVLLYRRWSMKLLVAHALRGVQTCIDTAAGSDRALYQASRALRLSEDRFGTMIYECFGVPILRSYTQAGMGKLFSGFSSLTMSAHGPHGYLWWVEGTK